MSYEDSYTDMKAAILKWTNKTTVTDNVQDMVNIVETKLNRKFVIPEMVGYENLSTVADQNTVDLPANTVQVKAVYIDQATDEPLVYVPDPTLITLTRFITGGAPEKYSVIGGGANGLQLLLAPNPDQVYTLRCNLRKKITKLSPSNETNAWLKHCPDALLYGALLEAEPFLKNDRRIPVWREKYVEALSDMKEYSIQFTQSDQAEGMPSNNTMIV